jgi:predicted Holliday junction resolvase-like endonuclease
LGENLSVIESLLIFLLVVGFVVIVFLVNYVRGIRAERDRLRSELKSRATLYGKISEQFAPFMGKYPYDPKKFRFIGTPIDGIQFEDDKIVFVEIKASQSKLKPEQSKIKRLVENKKVEWYTFQISI